MSIFLIPLCSGEYHINPDPHRLRGGSHEVERSVGGFDNERKVGRGGLDRVQMIDIHFFNTPKVCHSSLFLLRPIRIVRQTSLRSVEHEPSLVPMMKPARHLVQITAGRRAVQCELWARVQLMARGFNVLSQVQAVASEW
uniref:Uncharacterized protein n=1 Tax=Cacopsylla melanoneura TaxID=428564 RepID=A0A8D8V826_9HEMI